MIGSLPLAAKQLRCPLCDGLSFVSVRGVVGSLVKCERCGLHVSECASSDQSLYGDEFYAPPRRRTLAGCLFSRLERSFLKRRARVVSRLLPDRSGLRVLDVGCGAGGFLRALHALRPGLTLVGVESSKAGAAIARESGLSVSDHLPDPDGHGMPVDCITLWHVLEHVQDLHGFLESLNRLLPDGGLLVVAVPNITSFGCGLFRDHWGLLDLERHYWHFTGSALLALARRHDFDSIGPATTLMEYELPITVLSLINVLSGKDRMLFYNVIKKEHRVSVRQRMKMLLLLAALPALAMVAAMVDVAAAMRGQPNNLLQVFRKSARG